MEFLEPHARALYRLLNHGDQHSDCRALFAGGPLWDERVAEFATKNGRSPNAEEEKKLRVLDRTILKGEDKFIEWCRKFNSQANCYVGRNPRNPDGTVSRITTYSLDVDPEHPPRTSVPLQLVQRALLAGRDILRAWPGGYVAESGNGVLVLYRLSSPVCGDLDKFRRWLADWQNEVRKLLAVSYGEEIRCDSIHDNERIIKIPGTLSVKGDRENWRHARFAELPSAPYRSVIWSSATEEKPTGDQAPAPTSGTGSSRLLRRGTAPLTIERLDTKIQLAANALGRLKRERCDEYDSWIKVGLSLSELGQIGLQLWETWSKKSDKYQQGMCEAKWGTFTKDPLITVGSLVYWADQDNPDRTGSAVSGGESAKTESIDEFLQDAKPVDWICQGLVARGSIGFIAGLPETMKTWLVIDMALEAAKESGGNWLGLFPIKPCKVLYVDQERPRNETQRRFNQVMRAKGMTREDIRARFSMRWGTTTRINLRPSYDAFRHELNKFQPELVLVDSFATFHTLNENNLQDMQVVMEQVKLIRNEFGCAVIFLDHENKGVFHAEKEGDEDPSAFRMKGSVAKPAAAEHVFTVRRFDSFSSTVYNTKNTYGPKGASFTASVRDVPEGILVRGEK